MKISQMGPRRGGDLTFQTGKFVGPRGERAPEFDGSVVFMVGALEFLRLEPNGDAYCRGQKVDTDRKVYECFREWLGVASAQAKVPERRLLEPGDQVEFDHYDGELLHGVLFRESEGGSFQLLDQHGNLWTLASACKRDGDFGVKLRG